MCNEVCQPSKRALPYVTKAEHKFPSKKMQVQILYVKLQTWVSYRRKLQKMRQNMSKKGISHPSLPVQPAVPDSTYASSPGSCRRNGKQNLPTNSASQTEQCNGALLCFHRSLLLQQSSMAASQPRPLSTSELSHPKSKGLLHSMDILQLDQLPADTNLSPNSSATQRRSSNRWVFINTCTSLNSSQLTAS